MLRGGGITRHLDKTCFVDAYLIFEVLKKKTEEIKQSGCIQLKQALPFSKRNLGNCFV